MKLFEGKTPQERKKMIAAAALGLACLVVFYFAFGRHLFRSGTTTAASAKPTPTPRGADLPKPGDLKMPSATDQQFNDTTVPISYRPGGFIAPAPGRNIFAFYEPPPPCPECVPPPTPKPTPTPTPPPPPDMDIAFLQPQNVYEGSQGFRLEIQGDKFDASSRVFFNLREVPTAFVNGQRLTADIPAAFLGKDGSLPVVVQSADGKLHSNQMMFTVQAKPKPEFQYVGMLSRKRSNNDTAYFLEKDKQIPISARLNDVVLGRFRVMSISADETLLEDVNLGFKHRLELYRPPPGTAVSTGTTPGRPGFPTRENYVPYNQPNYGGQQGNPNINGTIPGIPNNVPRTRLPNANRPPVNRPNRDDDEDDDDDPPR